MYCVMRAIAPSLYNVYRHYDKPQRGHIPGDGDGGAGDGDGGAGDGDGGGDGGAGDGVGSSVNRGTLVTTIYKPQRGHIPGDGDGGAGDGDGGAGDGDGGAGDGDGGAGDGDGGGDGGAGVGVGSSVNRGTLVTTIYKPQRGYIPGHLSTHFSSFLSRLVPGGHSQPGSQSCSQCIIPSSPHTD